MRAKTTKPCLLWPVARAIVEERYSMCNKVLRGTTAILQYILDALQCSRCTSATGAKNIVGWRKLAENSAAEVGERDCRGGTQVRETGGKKRQMFVSTSAVLPPWSHLGPTMVSPWFLLGTTCSHLGPSLLPPRSHLLPPWSHHLTLVSRNPYHPHNLKIYSGVSSFHHKYGFN